MNNSRSFSRSRAISVHLSRSRTDSLAFWKIPCNISSYLLNPNSESFPQSVIPSTPICSDAAGSNGRGFWRGFGRRNGGDRPAIPAPAPSHYLPYTRHGLAQSPSQFLRKERVLTAYAKYLWCTVGSVWFRLWCTDWSVWFYLWLTIWSV